MVEPKKEDGERFRKVRVVSDDLKQFIHEVEPLVAKGADELASARLFGELIKRPEIREALKAGGLTDAMLDRWPEALAKSTEKAEKEDKKKPESKFKIEDEQLEYLLERFGRDLTKDAMLGKLDPVIGRESETHQMVEIALQRNRSNGLLLGEAGVGKTALFSALAQKIASGQVPEPLLGSKVYELDIQKMNEGAMFVGMFEARLKPILEGLAERNLAKENPPSIICVDEIAENMKVGGVSNASEIMKPMLSKGGLLAFAATTQDEYQKTLRKDKAFDRRWQVIHVDPPKAEHAVQILDQSQRERLEQHYKIVIPQPLLHDVVRLTSRFLANRHQPDVSITLLDQACAKAKMKNKTELELDDVMDAVAKAAHVDPEFIKHSNDRVLQLEDMLHERVLGQKQPLTKISNAILNANAGLNDPDKPLGSFLLLGPTGVGKTETARALAEILHGTKNAMIRIDMGKYKEAHSLSGLIGAPPGYVGHGEEGELTGQVRKRPYSVIVLDEIEKAHPDIFKYLLSILEEGELVDANNERINFRNTVILMTSNLKDPRAYFPPEFLNRLSGVLEYDHLPKEQIHKLVEREVGKVSDRLKVQWGLSIAITGHAHDQLAEKGFSPEYGARELKRVIEREIAVPLSRWLLRNRASLPKEGVIEISDIENFTPTVKGHEDKVLPFTPPHSGNGNGTAKSHADRLKNPSDPREVFPSAGEPSGKNEVG